MYGGYGRFPTGRPSESGGDGGFAGGPSLGFGCPVGLLDGVAVGVPLLVLVAADGVHFEGESEHGEGLAFDAEGGHPSEVEDAFAFGVEAFGVLPPAA